jgi:hypothetical protein
MLVSPPDPSFSEGCPRFESSAPWAVTDLRCNSTAEPLAFAPAGFGPPGFLLLRRDNVGRAHREGYAWQNWFSNEDRDAAGTWPRLIDMCVDGTMTSHPRAYERVLNRHERPASCG